MHQTVPQADYRDFFTLDSDYSFSSRVTSTSLKVFLPEKERLEIARNQPRGYHPQDNQDNSRQQIEAKAKRK